MTNKITIIIELHGKEIEREVIEEEAGKAGSLKKLVERAKEFLTDFGPY